MLERGHFTVKQTSTDQFSEFIDLNIRERVETPFTSGEIIYAETDLGSKVVIKKPAHNSQAEHEWLGLNIAYATGVPVPTPIALIYYTADQLAIVSTQIDGNNLFYFPNQEIKGGKDGIGRRVKLMHLQAKIDGNMWESSGRSTFAYYDKYMVYWSKGTIRELDVNSRGFSLLSSLSDVMEQFCVNSKPTFNHNDLHDGQIIVDEEGNFTIIDFGNWTEETCLNELSYHLFHLIRTDRAETDDFVNFLHGYCEGEKLLDVDRANLAFYLLFISSRAVSYFYRNHSPYLSTAKETHDKVLKYLDDEELWKVF